MNFDAVYTVKKEFGKEEFLRELIIELGLNTGTPVDVVDAEFKDVKESVKEVIVCTANVEGTCRASVGYDRQEPYTDYETYREKVGDSYVTRQRAVTKYRTVTDWQPYTAPYSGKATCAAYNSEEYDDTGIVEAIKTANKESIVEKGEAEVDSIGLSNAIAACKANVESSALRLPGDRQRDTVYSSEAEIQLLSCYKLPCYEVVYTYKGEEYYAFSFACGDINIYSETPDNDIDITSVVKEKTEGLEKTKKRSWMLFTISMIAATILCLSFDFPWLFPIPIILLLKAKKDSDRYSKEYSEYSDSLSKNIAESKVSAIKAALEKHGFEPLSKNYSNSLEGSSVPGAKELPSIKGRVVLSWVLVIILTLICIFKINLIRIAGVHSPTAVNIDVIEKRVEYNPDVSPYVNGCYYVHFDYEITAKRIGVDYIELKINVSDKKGDELGYITSSFTDVNLDKGDKKTVTATLEENQPENNEFFTELYNADFSDLKFDCDIQTIKFSNGEYYYNQD
ncbi:MAG: hypothetical protein IJ946_02475 [Clostridia bacterium]|nr:hypothetical protein [Clostridia bacterium]